MSRPKRLALVLALNLFLVAGLVGVGIGAHSLGVLAAGGDYLADAAAIGLSLFAIWLSRRPPTPRRPGGYRNATDVAALVNGGWLLVLSAVIIATAIRRLLAGAPEIVALPVLIASAVAAVVMLAGVLILGGGVDREDGGEDLNMKAIMLDTAADAAAAGGVAISGAVILAAGGWFWLDPVVALVIAAVVGYHAVNLLRKVLTALRPQPDP
ncbi:MAG: cation diffusion facilitator family transporter [Mycobacterium sp.]|uniref:cation diffusion facilitator family transporter n=1 Tax=Mycobacterium sp. TaxID=1785 RepID=UPI00262DB457|nr:cation diffusion facilitator family transporter [Mycobacterium sp.]MDI3312750.1 cation diffusion facilitator family transporter [Mycobacterium sp.]